MNSQELSQADKSTTQHPNFFWELLPLGLILILAVIIRLVFVTGVNYWDAFEYAQLAKNLSVGQITSTSWEGAQRVLIYAPVAVLYYLAGVNEVTSLAYPFSCSIFSVVLIYFIGKNVKDKTTGLISAFLWATMPISINAATTLLPDSILAAFVAVSVLLFLIGHNHQTGIIQYLLYGMSGIILAISYFVKPAGMPIFLFYAIVIAWDLIKKRKISREIVTVIMIVLIVLLLLYSNYVDNIKPNSADIFSTFSFTAFITTATDWWYHLVSTRQFIDSIPLFIIAIAFTLTNINKKTLLVVIWLAVSFLYIELGSMSLSSYEPMPGSYMWRQVLYVLLPFCVLSGVFLSSALPARLARWITSILSLALIILIVLSGSHKDSIISLIDTNQFGALPFYYTGWLASALAILFVILMVVAARQTTARFVRPALTAGFLFVLGVSYLGSSYQSLIEIGSWRTDYRKALDLIQWDEHTILLVQNSETSLRINYLTGFRTGFDWFNPSENTSHIVVAAKDLSQYDSMYVFIDQAYMKDGWEVGLPAYFTYIPSTWEEKTRHGNAISLYYYSRAAALSEVDQARQVVEAAPTDDAIIHLMKALEDSQDYCEKVKAWFTYGSQLALAQYHYDPSADLITCAQRLPGLIGDDLLDNPGFDNGLQDWLYNLNWGPKPTVLDNLDDLKSVLTVEKYDNDPKLINQTIVLKPDTWYLYEMRLKSTVPLTTLYFETDTVRFYEQGKTYPTWTVLKSAFLTPHWDGQSHLAVVYPVLVNGNGQVWIDYVHFSALNFSPAETEQP